MGVCVGGGSPCGRRRIWADSRAERGHKLAVLRTEADVWFECGAERACGVGSA